MKTALRMLAWNAAMLAVLVGVAAISAMVRADGWIFALPALLGLWVLFQAALFARRRWAVVACAVAGGALFLLQVAVLTFIVAWNRGFDPAYPANSLQVLAVLVLLGGAVLVAWLVRAKRRTDA